jgi:hypothetical protein
VKQRFGNSNMSQERCAFLVTQGGYSSSYAEIVIVESVDTASTFLNFSVAVPKNVISQSLGPVPI